MKFYWPTIYRNFIYLAIFTSLLVRNVHGDLFHYMKLKKILTAVAVAKALTHRRPTLLPIPIPIPIPIQQNEVIRLPSSVAKKTIITSGSGGHKGYDNNIIHGGGADIGSLYGSQLGSASLYGSQLGSASLYGSQLGSASLYGSQLGSSSLYGSPELGSSYGSSPLGSSSVSKFLIPGIGRWNKGNKKLFGLSSLAGLTGLSSPSTVRIVNIDGSSVGGLDGKLLLDNEGNNKKLIINGNRLHMSGNTIHDPLLYNGIHLGSNAFLNSNNIEYDNSLLNGLNVQQSVLYPQSVRNRRRRKPGNRRRKIHSSKLDSDIYRPYYRKSRPPPIISPPRIPSQSFHQESNSALEVGEKYQSDSTIQGTITIETK